MGRAPGLREGLGGPSWCQANWVPPALRGVCRQSLLGTQSPLWARDSRLMGGKAVIKVQVMNNNVTNSEPFSIR